MEQSKVIQKAAMHPNTGGGASTKGRSIPWERHRGFDEKSWFEEEETMRMDSIGVNP